MKATADNYNTTSSATSTITTSTSTTSTTSATTTSSNDVYYLYLELAPIMLLPHAVYTVSGSCVLL